MFNYKFQITFSYLCVICTHICKQWAAERIHCSEMMAHPQKWLPSRCIEHWYGARPSSASTPPIIRPSDNGENSSEMFGNIMCIWQKWSKIEFETQRIIWLTLNIRKLSTQNWLQNADQNEQCHLHSVECSPINCRTKMISLGKWGFIYTELLRSLIAKNLKLKPIKVLSV